MVNQAMSSYELWEILQGTSAIQDVDHVSIVIKENKEKLVKGLCYFEKPSTASKEKLEKETQVKPLRRGFVLKLSKFLNLDEWQSLELFHNYLQNAFRGSREQLKNVVKNEILTETLLIKVMEYYFEERIFILHSLESILSHWQAPSHPFQEPFSKFVNDVVKKDQLISEVWGQYKECCKTTIHHPEGNELDMIRRHSHRFAQQLLREQIEVLRIILFLFKDFEQPGKVLLETVKLFQAQGFGTRQVNRNVFDGFTELLITQVGFLQVIILVEAMNLESLIQCAEEGSLNAHPVAKEKSIIKELDAIFAKWGDLVHHGPVILAWTVVRFIIMETDLDNTQDVRRMGSKALQCNVFPYLLNLMKSAPFATVNTLSNSVKSVIYTLLSLLLTLFRESTLGDPQILIAVLKETLTSEELCKTFWQSELKSGMAILLKSVQHNFPFRFTPFTQIMTSLAKDQVTSEYVFNYLSNLKSFTEPSNVNSLEDVDCTDSDETLWKLINAKILYKSVVSTADKIVIPCGTTGKVYRSNEGIHLLRWSFKYSCWQLFLLELDSFLQHVPHSPDHGTQHFIAKVTDIIELVNNVLMHDWSKISTLVPLVDRIYLILQKCSPNLNCPPELISSCLKCLTTVTSQEPQQSWISFQQIGFFPFCVSSLQPTEKRILISSIAVDPGNFGNFLAAHERSQGSYPVTLATLDVIKELVAMVTPAETNNGNVPRMNDFIACLVFVCRDIFNGYQKWHYRDLTEKQEIGLKCLEIFHKVLTAKETKESQKLSNQTFDVSVENGCEETSNLLRLCEMLVEGILWTDMGQSLLHVVGVGMEMLDKLFAIYGSCCDSPAQLVVKLIKSALAVLNDVLERKPQCSEEHDLSPLEQALITHVKRKLSGDTPEGVHLVASIASYLYHHRDNELPTLSMELLRKICMISPMSMYGSLGSKAESLRDTFANRLISLTEDTRLKVSILEFLSAAVETQPGLMELFLDFRPAQTSSSDSKEFKIGSYSCLKPVLACITKETHSHVLVPVVTASLKFIYALWKNRRDTAMMTVKKSEKFWEHLSRYLMDNLPEECEEDFVCHVQIRSFVFQITALEVYYIKSGQVDPSLKKIFEKFERKDRYRYWSTQVSKVTSLSFSSDDPTGNEDFGLNFLRSWRSFLIVLADVEVSTSRLRDDDVKMAILEDSVRTIKDQLTDEITGHVLRIALESSSLFLMLLRKWIKAVQSPAELIELVANVLQVAHDSDPKLLAYIRIPLFSSLSLLIQHMRTEYIVEEIDQGAISSLLPLLCEPLQYRGEVLDTRESLRQNKLLAVTLCLLNETITSVSQPLKWIQIFNERALFTNLIQTVDHNLRKKENIDVIDAGLHFILSLCKYTEAAQALGLNFIVQPLCLGMVSLNEKSKRGTNPKTQSSSIVKSVSGSTWEDMWVLGLTVTATLLGKLRHEFLKESLDFVGVHREKIIQAMDVIRFNQSPSCLREAEYVTMLLVELSSYRKKWQLALPDVLQAVLSSTTVLLETCISLLIRPRLLAYLIEKPTDHETSKTADSLSAGRRLSRSLSSTSELLRPYSTPEEPLEKHNPKVVETQERLLRIVCNVLGFLKNFSPSICEIILDDGMDIDEYTPLFGLGFSAPALDNESAPSFGTLLSCLNVCLGHMHAADPRSLSSPDKSPWKFTGLSSVLPKSSVNFAMENSVILVLSQALLYLKDSRVKPANKQLLKRKLGSELEPFLRGVMRHFGRRGYTPSPGSTPKSAYPETARRSLGRSRSEYRDAGDQKDLKLFELVDKFLKTMIR